MVYVFLYFSDKILNVTYSIISFFSSLATLDTKYNNFNFAVNLLQMNELLNN
jgi:hypothetical protein